MPRYESAIGDTPRVCGATDATLATSLGAHPGRRGRLRSGGSCHDPTAREGRHRSAGRGMVAVPAGSQSETGPASAAHRHPTVPSCGDRKHHGTQTHDARRRQGAGLQHAGRRRCRRGTRNTRARTRATAPRRVGRTRPGVGPETELISYGKCIDLAAGQALPLQSHHDRIHTGRAGAALRGAGHLTIPTAPLSGIQDCAHLATFLPPR